ncbi:MAG: DUF475 domain-containing protein [Streptococcaceae bacterium]|nr:DUF475 domain-containing protein [Streptococcaceae bacterium]
MKKFRGSIIVTLIALILSFLYAGWDGLFITIILAILEISLSFDNAIVNARILEKMSDKWRKLFLTVGILVAVVGMRLLFPLLIVGISAKIDPVHAITLAMEKGDPHVPGTYGYILNQAHPSIAAFGGMFLLMVALDFFFTKHSHTWIKFPEKILEKIGHFPSANVSISLIILIITVQLQGDHAHTILLSGLLGVVIHLVVNGFGNLMNQSAESKGNETALAVGKAAFALFIYLEVIDASFSFDGVIGAFAITSDPILILLGLGVIGAMFVRSLTIYLVEKGTLNRLVYVEHGAHWAILALAILILCSIHLDISEVVTGLIGGVLIIASFISSIVYNRQH